MRRSCNALTCLFACLAGIVWAVGPSPSEAKTRHGFAGPIDCGYPPEFNDEWADDRFDSSCGDQAPAASALPVASPSPPKAPAWFGCGGLPAWPCGNFLAARAPEADAPYTFSPYWGVVAPRVTPILSSTRPANPVWFSAATGYDAAFDAAVAKPSASFNAASAAVASRCIKSEPTARVHWDALEDYSPCPLAQEEAQATASMARLEGGSSDQHTSGCEAEYTYMSAHDAAFGNACPSDSSLALNDYQNAPSVGRPANEQDYRPWNCDAPLAADDGGSDESAPSQTTPFRSAIDYSTRASRWLAIAAARTLEYYGALLSDLSLTMETAARGVFENAERPIPGSLYNECWE